MNFAQKYASDAVKLSQFPAHIGGARAGTVEATKQELINLFGPPHDVGDEKVTMQWVFDTPRGQIEIRDYWWNGPTEWSIGAAGHKEVQWLCRFLRANGIKCHYGTRAFVC